MLLAALVNPARTSCDNKKYNTLLRRQIESPLRKRHVRDLKQVVCIEQSSLYCETKMHSAKLLIAQPSLHVLHGNHLPCACMCVCMLLVYVSHRNIYSLKGSPLDAGILGPNQIIAWTWHLGMLVT